MLKRCLSLPFAVACCLLAACGGDDPSKRSPQAAPAKVTAQAVEGSSQADDAGCQCLRLTWRGGSASYSAAAFSGGRCGGFAGANAARCWRR